MSDFIFYSYDFNKLVVAIPTHGNLYSGEIKGMFLSSVADGGVYQFD